MALIDPPSQGAPRSTRTVVLAVLLPALLVFALFGSGALQTKPVPARVVSEETVTAPKLELDTDWPKLDTLPDPAWVMASCSGMTVDPTNDNVFILQRARESAEMIELGASGSILSMPILLSLIMMVLPLVLISCCCCCPCCKSCSKGANIVFKVAAAIFFCLVAIGHILGLSVFGRVPMEGGELGAITCEADCAGPPWKPAPFVIIYDKEGNYVDSWGGPGEGYDWPYNPHTITVDEEYVWISGGLPNPHEFELPVSRTHDTFILKFTKAGEFVMQIGEPYTGTGTTDPGNFNRPCGHTKKGDELYVADGHGYVRIAVLDAWSGELKRQWGGYGKVPDISLPQEERYGRTVHGVAVSDDGFVYVCDRDRGLLHVHKTDGTFVQEVDVGSMFDLSNPGATRGTFALLGFSGPWGVAFSPDVEQKYLYLSTPDQQIFIIERSTMGLLTTLGGAGVTPGLFNGMHSIASNSDGDVFVSEISHGRVQKFKNLGEATFPKYAHMDTYSAPPGPQKGPIYGTMTTMGLGVKLLHFGCPASTILPGPANAMLGAFIDPEKDYCSDHSWEW